MAKMTGKDWAVLVGSVLLAQAAGALGTIFTFEAIPTWYAALEKPFFSPPNWIFGPVWTLLYTLMGIAAFLVWRRRKDYGAMQALWLYGVHLVLNFLWSVLFFGLKMPGLALMEIVVLLAVIVAMAGWFYRYSKVAALLLIPYILWVSFATVLNAAIWLLNTGV